MARQNWNLLGLGLGSLMTSLAYHYVSTYLLNSFSDFVNILKKKNQPNINFLFAWIFRFYNLFSANKTLNSDLDIRKSKIKKKHPYIYSGL